MSDTVGWIGAIAIITFGGIGMAAFMIWLHHRDVDPGPRDDV